MRNTYYALIPGLRKFWLVLLAGLAAVTLTTLLVLEDFTCNRLAICFVQQETLTVSDTIAPEVAVVDLGTARADPTIEAATEGVLIAPVGSKGLFVSRLPIAQSTTLRLDPAQDADVAFASAALGSLAPSALAHLARTFPAALRVDPALTDDILSRTALQATPQDCPALDDAAWWLDIRRNLDAPPTSSEMLALSLLATALSCNRADLPGLTAAEASR